MPRKRLVAEWVGNSERSDFNAEAQRTQRKTQSSTATDRTRGGMGRETPRHEDFHAETQRRRGKRREHKRKNRERGGSKGKSGRVDRGEFPERSMPPKDL